MRASAPASGASLTKRKSTRLPSIESRSAESGNSAQAKVWDCLSENFPQATDYLEPHRITPLHWGVLSCLWREDGQPIKEVARQLEQLAGTLTVGLDAMERRHLIRRKQDETDGRVWRVWLLEKGKTLEFKLLPQVKSFVDGLFSCLSEKEYSNLASVTEKLQDHLESRSRSKERNGRASHVRSM